MAGPKVPPDPGCGAARRRRGREETLDPALAREGERLPRFETQALHWPVERLYTPLDLEAIGFDYLRDVGFPGQFPYTRGTEPNGYRERALDDDAGDRLRHRRGVGEARALHARPGPLGPDHRVRPADHQRLRLGPSAGRRRGGARGHRDRHARRHGGRARLRLRRAPTPDLGVQRPAAREPRDDHRGAREEGRRSGVVHAADAERDPDRVHLRGSLHLPARARAADRDRRDRVHDPQPPELAADLGGERAALRGARESGAGARVLVLDRDRSTSTACWRAASRSTRWRRTSRSSPASTWISSRRSASCAPTARSGRGCMQERYGAKTPGGAEAAS